MEQIQLMSHLVAGFPTDELAFEAARAMVAGGAGILEVQLPFSDPSADGPAIQGACTEVLSRHYRTADGLAFIARLHEAFPQTLIYLMSYGSLVYTPGVADFCKRAAGAGVRGMIIPDLPFDHDEGLTAACRANGMENIPVAAPSMAEGRLDTLAHAGFAHIYAALRTGITGSSTTVDEATVRFLTKVSAGGSGVYGGFGIQDGNQAAALASSVEAIVAGSVFVRLIDSHRDDKKALFQAVRDKALELTGRRQDR